MQDVISISCAALPAATRVVGFRGTERVSSPYELAIHALIPRIEGDDSEKILLEKITLTLDRQDGRPPLRWHGVIASVEDVVEYADASVCTIVQAPRLWKLSLTRHSRIFTDKPTPAIIEDILKESGFDPADYELRLAGSYKPREHVCQYLESDLAFLSRWMEREGIYYFFEQGDDVEKLIITDSAAYQQDFTPDPVRFVPSPTEKGNFKRIESIDAFARKQAASASRVRVDDYDYNRPDLELTGNADVAQRAFGEVRLYGENFSTLDEARRLAMVRAQELAARRKVFHGSGNVPYLRSGYTFTLDEHPRSSFNVRYLVTAIEHIANQAAHALNLHDVLGYTSDEVYRSKIVAIPASVQFRPERATPRPQIDGIVTATVDGQGESKFAQIDKQGRYKVRVKFDEGDLADGKASMFVRMLQPHGGSPEGFHFPLRKGTEVQLVFLGGDPDRPVIGAVAPNAQKPSVVTGENHTKNVIHTGGNNRLELGDEEGSQHATLSTPTAATLVHLGAPREGFHLVTQTDGRALHKTQGDWHVRVSGQKDSHVKGATKELFDGPRTTTVNAPVTEVLNKTVTSDTYGFLKQHRHAGQRTNVDETYTLYVNGEMTETCTGEVSRNVGGTEEIVVTGERSVHVQGGWTNSTDREYTLKAQDDVTLTSIGGKVETHSQEAYWFNYGHEESLTVGSKVEVLVGGSVDTKVGAAVDVYVVNATEITGGLKLELAHGSSLSIGELEEIRKHSLMLLEAEASLVARGEVSVSLQGKLVDVNGDLLLLGKA